MPQVERENGLSDRGGESLASAGNDLQNGAFAKTTKDTDLAKGNWEVLLGSVWVARETRGKQAPFSTLGWTELASSERRTPQGKGMLQCLVSWSKHAVRPAVRLRQDGGRAVHDERTYTTLDPH